MELEFKQIPQYPNYGISISGVVINLEKQKEVSQFIENGYLRLNLFKPTSKRNWHREPIHRLLAMTYMDYEPGSRKIVIDHINNDSLDNRLENLQIVTSRINSSKDRQRKLDLPTGVYPIYGRNSVRYAVRIAHNVDGIRQREYLGSYDTVDAASDVYQTRRQEIEINI